VPAGVLAALLYNVGNLAVFGLFTGLMLVFVLSFNSIGAQRDSAGGDSGPLTRLFEAGRALQGARRVDPLLERIVAEIRTLFRFEELHLALVDRERRLLDVRVHERNRERMPASTQPIDAGLFGWLVSRAEPLLVSDWRDAPPALVQRAGIEERTTGSLLAVPLVNDGIVLGLLCVQHPQPRTYERADLHLIRQLGDQMAGALASARAFEDLENYRRDLEARVVERTTELEKASTEKERLIAMLRERSQVLERESNEDPLTGAHSCRD
jgi:GAF domain-containing protein